MSRTSTCMLLACAALTGACATASTSAGTGDTPGAANTAAATDVSCPAGVSTQLTDAAKEANKALVLQRYQEAIDALRNAPGEEGNPQSQFLLAQAYAGGGNYAAADSAFMRTTTLCPGFEADVDQERLRAWARSYQAGLDSYQSGDTAAAIASWEQANSIYQGRADATFNLAVLASERGNYDRSVELFERTLEILEAMPADTAAAEMASRLETRRNAEAGMLNVGAQRFGAKDYAGASTVFKRLAELDPNNRDAQYNYALALYQLERWTELTPVAQKVVQIDPLNENAHVILFNAYKNQQQNDQALAVLETSEELPVKLTQVQIRTSGGQSTFTGTVEGNKAAAGTPVRLEFTVYGGGEAIATEQVTVMAPAAGATGTFDFTVDSPTPANSYSYRIVG